MKLSVFLKALPHLKPRKATEVLQYWQSDLFEPLVMDPDDELELTLDIGEGIVLTTEDFENIFYLDYSSREVTPYGASRLLEIYRAGLLPLHKRCVPAEIPADLLEYARSKETVADIQSKIALEAAVVAEQYSALLSNPDAILPKDFTFSLLNNLFIRHQGFSRGGIMQIGGVTVTKTVTGYFSNSGKSRGWEVVFSWLEENGQPRSLQKSSVYANNRRNDVDRNWGLPE